MAERFQLVNDESAPAAEHAHLRTQGDDLIARIMQAGLGATPYSRPANAPAVHVPVGKLFAFMTELHKNPTFSFDLLIAHTAVDRIAAGEIELIYTLISLEHNATLIVSTALPRENPVAPSLSTIWAIAEWQEREVYDLFGVLYENHPDLRRVFLEDDWTGFPLRKDYVDDFMLTREEESGESA